MKQREKELHSVDNNVNHRGWRSRSKIDNVPLSKEICLDSVAASSRGGLFQDPASRFNCSARLLCSISQSIQVKRRPTHLISIRRLGIPYEKLTMLGMDGLAVDDNPLVRRVEELLAEGQFDELLDTIFRPENVGAIQTCGMDLITKICECGLNFADDHSSIAICSSTLIYIVQNYRPKEALISLLEQAEALVSSEKFTCLLNPLQHVILALPKKREKSFSWVFAILRNHLHSRPLSHDLLASLNDPTCDPIITENHHEARTIMQTYKNFIYFYTPFVDNVEEFYAAARDTQNPEDLKSARNQRHLLRDYLVDTLGFPILHFPLEAPSFHNHCLPVKKSASCAEDPSSCSNLRECDDFRLVSNNQSFSKEKNRVKTEAKVMVEGVMDLLARLDSTPHNYCDWITSRVTSTASNDNNSMNFEYDSSDEDEEDVVVGMSSVLGYYYLIFVEQLNHNLLASVLSPTYLFQTMMHPIATVLKHTSYTCVLRKALMLGKCLIDRFDVHISPLTSTEFNCDHRLHSSLVHTDIGTVFVTRLTYAAVYCEQQDVRTNAFMLFKKYLLAFDPQGRYELLKIIFHTIPNDSLIGLMVTQLKDFIAIGLGGGETLSELEKQEMEKVFVKNRSIQTLIHEVCVLPQGVTSDLCAHSSRIISSLNLIRFLLLRDGSVNKTGIVELFPRLESSLLHPLRKALDLSKAHYDLKLKELCDPYTRKERLKEEKRLFEALEADISIAAGLADDGPVSVPLKPGDISLDEQRKSVEGALNTFEHMKGLLAWLYEAHPHAK